MPTHAAIKTVPASRTMSGGFTLVELMITIAIVGILAAIAIPSYREHVRRGAVEEGLAQLASGRVALEQHFLDNRTYSTAPCPAGTAKFPIDCDLEDGEYVMTATGNGNVAGFEYSLDETGQRLTVASPWGTGSCWITRKGDSC